MNMIRTSLVCLCALLCIPVHGTPKSSSEIGKEYFDAVLHGRIPYRLPGITGHELVAYQLINDAGDLISVRLTFSGPDGDRTSTKRFTIDVKGTLHAVERVDIRDAILVNLALVSKAAQVALSSKWRPIDWNELINLKLIDPGEIRPFEAENYSEIRIEMQPDGVFFVKLNDSLGQEVCFTNRIENNKLSHSPVSGVLDSALLLSDNPPSSQQIRPRSHLDRKARPGLFAENKIGTANIGPMEVDPHWSSYGQYLQKVLEAVQAQWEKLLQGRTYPASGSVVTVKFVMDSTGAITNVVSVDGGSIEQQSKGFCVAAITDPSPYGKWSDDMIAVLGEKQEMTFVFYYQ